MIELSLDHGATIDEIRAAIAENRLHAVPAERVIAPGTERLTLDEVVARAGVDPGFARQVWRALGFVEPRPGRPSVLRSATSNLMTFYELASRGVRTRRLRSRSRARLGPRWRASPTARSRTHARCSKLRCDQKADRTPTSPRTFVAVAEQVIPPVYPMLETVHRRHLLAAGRRYSAWGVAPTMQHTSDAVVGFADVVGYTSLTQRISADELERLVVGFEERALAATARPGARLVKTIGDEVMFVAGAARRCGRHRTDLGRATTRSRRCGSASPPARW